MQIAEKFDVSTLTWIKGEIDETLKQARIALETFVEEPDDESQLRFCVNYLHQVRGTLQMVELFGAAQFATEMEQLALALQNDDLGEKREEGYEVLMRAILQLPDYLENLQTGQSDNPIALLPMMNEMRQLRGEEPLAEMAYFRPDLTVMPPGKAAAAGKVDIRLLVKKLRPYLQSALLHIIKGQNVAKALQTIATVLDKLSQAAQEDSLRQFLWVNGAFIEALNDGGAELNANNKQLIGKLDQMAKLLEAKGEKALSREVLANLVRMVLLQVGKSASNGPKVTQVRASFHLDSMLSRQGMSSSALSGFNAELKRTVSADLMDELSRVKDSFDIFVRSDRSDTSSLQPLSDSLATMAETLGMIREEKLQEKAREQVGVMRQLINGEVEADDDSLMGIAGAILSVESALKDWGNLTPVEQADAEEGVEPGEAAAPEAEAEHRRIVGQVMKEARDDLIKVREAITNYLNDPTEKITVQYLPEWLQRIIGSLVMLSYKRVAQVLRAVNLYLNAAILHSDKIPPTEDLDALADVVMSVEYYLEAFIENRVHPSSVLDVAEKALSKLGYSVDELSGGSSGGAAPSTDNIELEESDEESYEGFEVSEEEAPQGGESAEAEEPEAEELTVEPEPTPVEEEPEAVEVDLSEEDVELASEPEPQPEQASEPEAAAPPEVDEEILEIFIEEAGEVLENIDEYMPRWKENQSDQDALTDLRRAYHTLKGSGRLVGANVVGEFAWAFENMLNKVIEGTIKPNATLFDMLDQAREILPDLVESFKTGKAPPDDYLMLQEMADEITSPGKAKPKAEEPAAKESSEPVAAAPEAEPLEAKPIEIPDLDPVLLEIYSTEAESHIEAVRDFVHGFREEAKRRVSEPLIRALHTLTGSSRMAGVMGVAEISGTLEKYAKNLQATNTSITEDAVDALEEMVNFIEALIAHLEDRDKALPDNTALVEKVNALYKSVEHLEEEAASKPEAGLASVAEEEPEEDTPSAAAEAEEIDLAPPSDEGGDDYELELSEALEAESTEEPESQEESSDYELELTDAMESDSSEDIELTSPEEEGSSDYELELTEALEDETPTSESEEDLPVEATAPEAPVESGAEPPPAEIAKVEYTQRVSEQSDYNAEAVEVFLDDGHDIIDRTEDPLQEWFENPGDTEIAQELERQFGALRLSAWRADIEPVAELSQRLVQALQAIRNGQLAINRELTDLIQLVYDRLREMLEQVRKDEPVRSGDDLIADLSEQMKNAQAAPPPAPEPEPEPTAAAAPAAEEGSFYPRVSELPDYDPDLVDIFLEEGQEIIDASEETLQAWVDNPSDTSKVKELERQLHTLKGSARMSGITAVGDLSHHLETTFEAMVEGRLSSSKEMTDLLQLAHDRLVEMLEQVRNDQPVRGGEDIIERIHRIGKGGPAEAAEEEIELTAPAESEEIELTAPAEAPPEDAGAGEAKYYPRVSEQPDYDSDLAEIFLEEGQEILDQSEETLQAWVDNPDDVKLAHNLERQLHTLKGGARMAGIQAIGDLSHSLESTFEAMVEGRLSRSKDMTTLLQLAHDRLGEMLQQVRNDEPIRSGDDLIARIESGDKASAAESEAPTPSAAVESKETEQAEPAASQPADEASQAPATESSTDEELTHGAIDVTKEGIAKLIDRGPGYAQEIRDALGKWRADSSDEGSFNLILRSLHLLRLDSHTAAIEPIGDLLDRVSKLFNKIKNDQIEVSKRIHDVVEQAMGRVAEQIEQLKQGHAPQADDALAGLMDDLLGDQGKRVSTTAARKEQESEQDQQRNRRHQQRQHVDTTRVRSDLLNDMVNFAGEISIYRARIEQELTSYRSTMDEMDQTLERLREQLRKFDIETEAQMQSRFEEQAGGYEDFDPLEFDRFNNMQQVSRSMMESLSDLGSLRDILLGVTREAETLLLQQSRVNTELQETLVRTRMVPLVENAPRLRRIVRQTCAELHKKAVLRFQGAEVEMDRNVVEHMLAPIEHLLRNSVAHGIEAPKERTAKGKDDEGTITIAQSKEGSEVVIRVIDDGAGINIEAVKEKAIARGLMKPGSKLSDKEIASFILESGFSTAQSLSQISGRGVGMDVVASEVKQLGGVLELDFEPGKGSTFIARLPLTLSVSRALLVQASEDIYAVPLLSIQAIERVSPQELKTMLDADRPVFNWLGDEYELMQLTRVLGLGSGSISQEGKQPILLARSGDNRVALAVDGLLGSREVVVKSLGPQLSTLQELAGATILADGNVALILDLPALIRKGVAQLAEAQRQEYAESETEAQREPLVMVVDDSITVRKVTERLLTRNHFKSITAKDGVDALTVLEENIPDVMLLDIEMPRMDGYELATHMRNSDRYKDIPIIMITSRTGEKHRQRAMDIGVNVYMGKPYTETDLMTNIKKLIGMEDEE